MAMGKFTNLGIGLAKMSSTLQKSLKGLKTGSKLVLFVCSVGQ